MIVDSIRLKNFKPFYGTNSIDFELTNGILLVGAKNDRGKTALLESIYFCLYGFDSGDELSSEEKRNQCINKRASTEGDGEVFVEITFTHKGKYYSIKRVLTFLEVENEADRTVEKHDVIVTVEEGEEKGHEVLIDTRDDHELGDCDDFIDNVLPQNISKFFIFDGERIDQFAKRFGIGDSDVRESIETILGVDELNNSIKDLKRYAIDFYKDKYINAKSRKDERDNLKKELRSIDEKHEKVKEDISTKSERIDVIDNKIRQAEKDISKATDLKNKYEDLVRAEYELNGNENIDNPSEYLSSDEIDDLTPSLSKKISDTRSSLQALNDQIGPVNGLIAATYMRSTIELNSAAGQVAGVLQKMLHNRADRCYVCGRDIDEIDLSEEDEFDKPRDYLSKRLEAALKETTDDGMYILRVANELINAVEADDISRSELVSKYRYLTNRLEDLYQRRRTLSRRKERIRDAISTASLSVEELDEVGERLEDLKHQRTSVNKELSSLKNKLNDIEEERRSTKNDLSKIGHPTQEETRFKKLVDISQSSRMAFKEIKDIYIEQQRKDIQEKASSLFLSMTNKPDVYKGLNISKNYRLQIKTDGGVVSMEDQDPSRGARQIIAYSFIAGLAQFSSRDAPILVDTPVARLDDEHKENLLSEISHLSHQVAMFYQPNELSEDDINKIDDYGNVINNYDIVEGNEQEISTITEHSPENIRKI